MVRQPIGPSGQEMKKRDQSNRARPERSVDSSLDDRSFIAWDGEGINLSGPGWPQSYVLFGSTEGHIESKLGLNTFDCLDHIIDTGIEHPGAVHVGFAFSYDANMICKTLAPMTLSRLHSQGW